MRSTASLLKPASEPLGADLPPSILEVDLQQTSAAAGEVFDPVKSINCSVPGSMMNFI
jgi:hypothetical protein